MSYLIEQQEVTGLSQQQTALPQQQIQSMHISFDTTGYPIAPIAPNQPVAISETSKRNSLWVAGLLVVGLSACSGTIGHYLGASGEAQKAQQQQAELSKMRSDIAKLCKQYNQ
jgi:hypothetical protein